MRAGAMKEGAEIRVRYPGLRVFVHGLEKKRPGREAGAFPSQAEVLST